MADGDGVIRPPPPPPKGGPAPSFAPVPTPPPLTPAAPGDPTAHLFGAGGVAAALAGRVRACALERARRRYEALNLYRPLPAQAEFHSSRAQTRVLRGSNRGGKTLPAAVEVARAVCGRDPFGKWPKRDGRFFVVGKDQKHIGQVIFRKLFRAGAFKIIRDVSTLKWRAFHPVHDAAREADARSAPPLIPKRMIKEIGWENKKENVPNTVKLVNGWEITFFSSLGKPPQGSDIDGWWFDEEIVDPDWLPEMQARILDRRGRGLWSATPQSGTEQLYDLHERAERERDLAAHLRAVEEFLIFLTDNPHIREEDKRTFAANLSDEEARVRIQGEFLITSYRIYPEFSPLIHNIDLEQVPADWSLYAVTDPGHRVCAVLFAAVPPDEKQLVLYDELYLKECNAALYGEAMARKCGGRTFQAFLIDPNMGRYTDVGHGKTVAEQYGAALRERGVRSASTGSDFLLANDDIPAGLLAVRDLLRIGREGHPRLRVRSGWLPHFEYEIRRYHRKRVAGQVTDAPDAKKDNHLMDCLRYMVLYAPRWVRARAAPAAPAGAVRAYRAKQERERAKQGGSYLRLGPGKGRPT